MGHSSDIFPSIDRSSRFPQISPYDGMGFATRAIEVGNDSGRSAVPIYASVTADDGYQRHGDPTRDALCLNLASLEGTRYALVTASGMAAFSLAVLAVLEAGDRILCHRDLYIWSYFFAREDLPRLCGARVDMVDMTDLDALEQALKAGKTKLVCFETIANPMMNVPDIAACCELAHRYGALVLVDNTFASPYLCRPAELGADIVIESLTKYINGHGDALGGAVCTGSDELFHRFQRMMGVLGPCLSPHNMFLVLRGIQTLALRMERHCDNAEALVDYLKAKPFVRQLTYPGLPEHPQHETAKRQLRRYGGMLGFLLDADHGTLHDVILQELHLFRHWVSLGEAHSLISPKAADPEKGIPADFIRISSGLEDPADLIADLERAFQKAGL